MGRTALVSFPRCTSPESELTGDVGPACRGVFRAPNRLLIFLRIRLQTFAWRNYDTTKGGRRTDSPSTYGCPTIGMLTTNNSSPHPKPRNSCLSNRSPAMGYPRCRLEGRTRRRWRWRCWKLVSSPPPELAASESDSDGR